MTGQGAKHWHDWDDVPQGECHKQVFTHVEAVEREQRDIHTNNVEYARLYSNREEPGLSPSQRARFREADLVTENVISSVVDTATSLIGKSRPKIRILTDQADWSLQQTAKRLEKYLWGLFQALRIHESLTSIFRDACIFGTGVLKLYARKGKVCVERALIDEIIVDENECPHGGLPRQMQHLRLVSKEVLKRLYPDHAEEIEKSSTAYRYEFAGYRPVDPGMVLVVETWHLGPDGRHAICVSEGTLLDEVYSEDWFPFVFYHWSPPLTGFYGQGLAEALLGFQIRINELNDFIQRCQDLIAVPRVALDAGSKVFKPHLDNEIGAIIPYVGKPPVFFTPTALNSEIYAYKEQLKAAAFEFAGVSKMAAQATRPEGIEAAVALRELSDNQNQRFSVQQQRFEDAAIQVAEMLCRLCSKMYTVGKKGKDGSGPPKVFMAESFVETIDWPEVDLDEKRFVLSVQAASIMSETPAGRLQRVIELAQYGVQLDQAELRRLLGNSDVASSDDVATSKLDDADWTIEELSHGRWPPIEGFSDLVLVIERATAAYLRAKRTGAPEDIQEGFRQWIHLAEQQIRPPPPQTMGADPAAMQPQMMDPMMAGAAPQPILPPSAAMDAGALPGLLIPPNMQPGY
jgi:hypothetical protein